MRKSWVRLSLALAGGLFVMGQASAQATVNYWYNQQGDAANSMPSVIDVAAGSSITLSVYVETQGVGPLSAINAFVGYSTTSTLGAGATRDDNASPLATFNSFTWGQADMSTLGAVEGGGGGPADGVSRPFGYFVTAIGPGNGASPFAGSNDNVAFHVMDITLNINAADAPGTDIPISIWSYGTTDNFASSVLNSNFAEYYPSAAYNGTLHVAGVPEPTTMVALGIGAAALLRRRRRA